jgi:hypothetical protein
MVNRERLARYLAAAYVGAETVATFTAEQSAEVAEAYRDILADRDYFGPIDRTRVKLSEMLREVSDPDPDGDRFAVAEALYAFCSHYHGGQWSRLYAVLGQLGQPPIRFRPGMATDGVSDFPQAERVYAWLRRCHAQSAAAAEETAESLRDILAAACWDDPERAGD